MNIGSHEAPAVPLSMILMLSLSHQHIARLQAVWTEVFGVTVRGFVAYMQYRDFVHQLSTTPSDLQHLCDHRGSAGEKCPCKPNPNSL